MIKYPKTFYENLPAGFDGEFNWEFLLPIFKGTKIQPMDIDAVVERNGYILMMETKSPGISVPLGQRITLEACIKNGRGKTYVYVIYGKVPYEIVGMEQWYFSNSRVVRGAYHQCDWQEVYGMVDSWYRLANKGGVI